MSVPKMPANIYVGNEPYGLVLLQVRTKNDDGSPSLLRHVRDDDKVNIKGGEQFVTAYVPRGIFEGK